MSTISEPCYVCDGDGEILDLSIGEDCAEFIPCPTCNGTGEIETEDCKERDE
jgi:DnaJ-class molecular chaperone